jgi:hypothetical protein
LESVSDLARVLLTAVVLSAIALAMYVRRLTQLDSSGPERLVSQLRLAQWAALTLSALGAVSIGLAVSHDPSPFGSVEITLGLAFVIIAAVVMQREPREALLLAAAGFVLHALLTMAHRPGLLDPVAPPWFSAGTATFDVFFAAICYWARRR